MAKGNDMMMEAVKLVDGIVGDLRGFDETPPPKKVWLEIADRLEKAFGQYREGGHIAFHEFMGNAASEMGEARSRLEAASGSGCFDKDFHEQMGNVGRMRGILNKVHDWLGVLIRDSRPDDRCKECLGASDLADDVYDAIHSPVRNCDRFSDETEAQVAFLNEVWLISVTDLKHDPFDEWTPEMKARYAKWLLELKDAKDGGDAEA